MSNPAAGRQMPTCQGPGESDLAGNEEDAISLKCQCSGPNVAILEYRGEPSDPPKKVCSNLLLTTNMLTCLEKLALNWVDIYGYIHALSLVGLSPLKYHANVSSTNLWKLFAGPCREAVYIRLNPAFFGRISMQPTLDVMPQTLSAVHAQLVQHTPTNLKRVLSYKISLVFH